MTSQALITKVGFGCAHDWSNLGGLCMLTYMKLLLTCLPVHWTVFLTCTVYTAKQCLWLVVLSLFVEWEYSHQVECGNNHEGRSVVSEERGRGTEKVWAFACQFKLSLVIYPETFLSHPLIACSNFSGCQNMRREGEMHQNS